MVLVPVTCPYWHSDQVIKGGPLNFSEFVDGFS